MGHIVYTKYKRNGTNYRRISRRYSREQTTCMRFVVERRMIIKFILEEVCMCVCLFVCFDVWNHSRWLMIEFIVGFL